jgi:glycosyltransferase involved in cell wall biosynthesis
MKILFVTQSLGKGGAERLVLDIANTFQNFYKDVKVKIIPIGSANDYPEMSERLDIEVCSSKVQLSLTGKSTIEISEFERIVDEFQPDVIHSHTYVAELVSREHIRPNIAYFSHVHNDFPEFDPLSFSIFFSKSKIARYYERNRIFKKYKKCKNQFITISKSIDLHLKKQVTRDWHPSIHLVPNGINLEKFSAEPRAFPMNEKIRFISIGRLYPVKNHAYLIRAMEVFKKNNPELDWELNILGEGAERQNLELLIDELGLQKQVHLRGLINNVEFWLKESHIYLQCSISESFGLSYVEALAAGLPIVSLDAGGNRDIISHEINGILLSKETDEKTYAKWIQKLVVDQKFYEEIAAQATISAQNFDIRACARQLLEYYSSTILATKDE